MNVRCRLLPVSLAVLCLVMVAGLVLPECVHSVPTPARVAARMRPYAGIGVLMLKVSNAAGEEPAEALQRYDEPGIARRGELDSAGIPRYEWIFGPDPGSVPLVVVARKGAWLKVVYDDAGREAWINPGRKGSFQPWDLFLKGQSGRLLPALHKRYYQLFRHPGTGSPLTSVTPRQVFKMILLEGDWAVVMPDPDTLSWVRWRDEDGRLLICLERGVLPTKLK